MRKLEPPRITQAAPKAALARRRKPISAPRVPGTLREAKRAGDGSEFVKYTRGQIVFKTVGGLWERQAVLALYIPPGATVFRGLIRWGRSARKCRTERVYVIGRVYGEKVRRTRKSYHGPYRQRGPGYKSGEWVTADGFDTRFVECAEGIHFFETFAEARNF